MRDKRYWEVIVIKKEWEGHLQKHVIFIECPYKQRDLRRKILLKTRSFMNEADGTLTGSFFRIERIND